MNSTGDLRYELSSELRSDENILWTGQPDGSKLFTAGSGCLMGFGLFWLTFSLFWESIAIKAALTQGGGAWGMVLFGIPFVLIGLGLVVGLPFADYNTRKNTVYAITSQRVIVKIGAKMNKVTSYLITSQMSIQKFVQPSGRGAIKIGYGRPLVTTTVNGKLTEFGTPLQNVSNTENSALLNDIEDPDYAERVLISQIERAQSLA